MKRIYTSIIIYIIIFIIFIFIYIAHFKSKCVLVEY